MKYHYKCQDETCGAISELVQSIHKPLPDVRTCGFCPSPASLVLEAPAVLTGSMGNQPIDVTVGHMADARREQIAERQQKRDKVRKESGQVGLKATSHDTFRPITRAEQAARESMHHRVQQAGGAKQELEASDRKLVGA